MEFIMFTRMMAAGLHVPKVFSFFHPPKQHEKDPSPVELKLHLQGCLDCFQLLWCFCYVKAHAYPWDTHRRSRIWVTSCSHWHFWMTKLSDMGWNGFWSVFLFLPPLSVSEPEYKLCAEIPCRDGREAERQKERHTCIDKESYLKDHAELVPHLMVRVAPLWAVIFFFFLMRHFRAVPILLIWHTLQWSI